jgi:crossover junction endodeoxyribonuclease RuvC
MSHLVGVDPGLSGALAFLDPNNPSTIETADIPVHVLARGGKTKREIDIVELIRLLATRHLTHAFVEQVSSMPGQGLSSTFSFGKTYGAILGVVASRSIPLTLVPSLRWKRALHVPKAKDGARARASQLLPEAAHQWRLRKDHGKAEAALIALYGARQLSGTAAVPADLFVLSIPAAPQSLVEAR